MVGRLTLPLESGCDRFVNAGLISQGHFGKSRMTGGEVFVQGFTLATKGNKMRRDRAADVSILSGVNEGLIAIYDTALSFCDIFVSPGITGESEISSSDRTAR